MCGLAPDLLPSDSENRLGGSIEKAIDIERFTPHPHKIQKGRFFKAMISMPAIMNRGIYVRHSCDV
jgi:hypothetical protein